MFWVAVHVSVMNDFTFRLVLEAAVERKKYTFLFSKSLWQVAQKLPSAFRQHRLEGRMCVRFQREAFRRPVVVGTRQPGFALGSRVASHTEQGFLGNLINILAYLNVLQSKKRR